MCQDQNINQHARCITDQHEEKHRQDHSLWSRRQFLSVNALATMGVSLGGGMLAKLHAAPMLQALLNNADCGDRVLILVRLFGGNDGLNTIVPFTETVGRSKYEQLRPTIKIEKSNLTPLSNFGPANFGVNTASMGSFLNMWNGGKASIIHSMGYPQPDLSHFVSSQYWSASTQSTDNSLYYSGWMGRSMHQELPGFLDQPPSIPPAIEIGSTSDLTFKDEDGTIYGLAMNDVDEFYKLAKDGKLYDIDENATCAIDQEKAFMRSIANNSNRYAQFINQSYQKGSTNSNTYANREIGKALRIIARLIKGRLKTRIYMVTMGGYDTHSGQLGYHENILNDLFTSIRSLYDDLGTCGMGDNVMTFVFSEFGRTVDDNGSGTDHGHLNDGFLFGGGVQPGFFGNPQNLNAYNYNPSQRYIDFSPTLHTDFRGVYAQLLTNWLCVDPVIVQAAVGGTYNAPSGLVIPTPGMDTGKAINMPREDLFVLGHTTMEGNPDLITVRFALKTGGVTDLTLEGNAKSWHLVNNVFLQNGSHSVVINKKDLQLAQGQYTYTLRSAGTQTQRTLIIK